MFVSIIVFAILTNNNNFDVKIAFNYPKTTYYANNCLKTNYCWHRVQVNSGIAFWSDWQFYIIRLCISCTCACESLQFETYRVSIFICILTICIFYCFLIRRCCCYGNLLWKVNELSMFVKSAGNFLCSFFTIIITEKKRKNITTITAEWSVPNSFFWSHFNFISPLFQSRRKNEQWLNVD